jgi:hypothetical protein
MTDATNSSSSGEQRKWRVWATADKLEEAAKLNNFYPSITPKVVSLLRQWGSKWEHCQGWMSLLDKRSLLHEMEESIVAIHHLFEATSGNSTKYIAVDVCGGKGLFSFLLSYLRPPNVDQIILLEKASINWIHIDAANVSANEEGRPKITIWSNTNLHDYDEVLERLLNLPHPVAMTGIHLCKQLGPSFCGLVNGLGREKCMYACLAPCCLPRVVTTQKNKANNKPFSISITLEESVEQRQSRRDYMERRARRKRKPVGGPCFQCHDENHGTKECPILFTLPDEERIAIFRAEHVAIMPCFNCMQYGHFKTVCPMPITRVNPPTQQPPMLALDVSNVLKTERPFSAYCHLLAGSLQNRQFQVVEAELQNVEKHQKGNWNSERKSIFIVAT